MIRERAHIATKDLSGWNRTLEVIEECNRMSRERSWPETRAWTLVSGPFNEIVLEADFADLAEYERVQQEMNVDPGWMILIKPALDAMVVERSYSELLMTADPVG